MDEQTLVAERIEEGKAALRDGDRTAAHGLFSELTRSAPDNVDAWIGLAVSSPTAAESAAALHRAEEIEPANRFVAQAEAGLTTRVPGFASALAAARAPDLEPELTDTQAEVIEDAGPRRLMLNLGLGLLVLLLLAAVGFGFLNSDLNRPAGPTPVPPTAIAAPSGPPATAVASPVAHLPPPAIGIPTVAKPLGDLSVTLPSPTGTPSPAEIERHAALDAVSAGRYADAIPALEAATERHPNDAEALYNLGVAYFGAADRPHSLEDATLTFRSVQALQPHWAPGLDMLAHSLIAQGLFRDAVTPAHQAVESDPTRAEYWTTLGQAYQGAGAAAEAAKAFDEAAHRSAASGTPSAGSLQPVAPTGTVTITPTPATSTGTPTATPTRVR